MWASLFLSNPKKTLYGKRPQKTSFEILPCHSFVAVRGTGECIGVSACRRLQSVINFVEVSWSDAEERQKALKAGFARFLTKPVDPEQLVQEICNVLEPH